MNKDNVCAGLDIGGTGIRFVIMQQEKEIATSTLPTAHFDSFPALSRPDILARHISSLLPVDKQLTAVGIGASGPVNTDTGVIDNPHTLPGFSGMPLPRLLSECLQVPVRIDNDAVTAALGEYYLGAGIGSRRMLMVTLGTGVGVALLDNGKPFRTVNGEHPECGHIPVSDSTVECYCGLSGCWETLASRTWLQSALLRQLPDITYQHHTLRDWQQICSQSPSVREIFHQYGRQVGKGLNSLIMAYGPDVTVLSGSAAQLYPLYARAIEQTLRRKPGFEVSKTLKSSMLGDTAGALGATFLHKNKGNFAYFRQ